MKKKICYWLDSNQNGIIPMRDGKIYACCTRAVPILVDKKRYYDELSLEDIQKNRIALYEAINNGSAPQCEGCVCLKEKEDKKIEIGKISYLIYHPHTTCNLKCVYCFFQKGEQDAKLDLHMVDLLSAVKNFHKIGLLKEDFSLELGGGEPLLLENIPETIEFLEKFYPKCTLVLVSNYTLTDRINKLLKVLKNKKIKTVLKTSIDCGTKETYKKIRFKDYYDTLCNNLLKSAQENVYDTIYLKYILLEDKSNTDDENINGFIELCKQVAKVNKNKTKIILDADMLAITKNGKDYFKEGDVSEYTEFIHKPISKDMINAARKIYFNLHFLSGLKFVWYGDRLNADNSCDDIWEITKFISLSSYFFASKKILKKIKKFIGYNSH